MDLSYYSLGTIFCFHSEKKPPVANYSFSITDGGGGGREGVIAIKAVFPQLSPHNRAEEKRNNYKSREGT